MRGRRGGSNGLDAWPGYVDALSTLLMVTIFVLLVFVLAEAFLSSALSGSDNTINQLRGQIAELSSALSLEQSNNASLAQELAALNSQLSDVKAANANLSSQLAAANAARGADAVNIRALSGQLSDAQAQAQSATARIAALQGQLAAQAQAAANAPPSMSAQLQETQQQLAAQKNVSQSALDEVDLLNQQVAALRLQMAMLAQALDAAEAADKRDNVQIVDLGKQLNEALARKVEELQQYRSEFFGTLRSILANEPNIKIVGDRFVFESDVLFPLDQATMTPAGQAEIGDVAKVIKKIAGKIPPSVNWVLSVDGYADAQPVTGGPFRDNYDLSAARALAVLHLLVADGVPADRVAATAFGSANPIATGTTAQDYAQNRRIEFRLTNRLDNSMEATFPISTMTSNVPDLNEAAQFLAVKREARLSPEELIQNTWTFNHRNGHVIAEQLRFSELGLIEDYQSENEVAWNFHGNTLRIFRRDGALMWIADEATEDEYGAWIIRLTTHHDSGNDVYLRQVVPHLSPPSSLTSTPRRHRYTGAKRVLILRNGLDVQLRLGRSLANAELFLIDNEKDIENFPDCNVFISNLVLTHARTPAQASAFIARVTSRFPLAIFMELSGHEAAYLSEHGLQSYHRVFDENGLMDVLNLDFVASAAASSGVFKVEHFVDSPAFDSFKGWIVSNNHPRGEFPTVKSRGAYQIFDRPVFEISAYACYGFEALDLPLHDDLTLLEMRTLRFRAQSSGFQVDRADRVTHPRELGTLLYNTFRDAPASWRDRPISVPIMTEDHDKYRDPRHEALLKKWRGEFKVEIAELSVYELQDCIIGGTGTLFTRGQMVWGTDYLLVYLYSSKLDPIMRGLQRRHPAQHIDGIAICGFNSLYDNYYHWVAQAMVAISLCIDLLAKRNLPRITIVTGKLDSTRRAYMDLLLQGDSRFHVVDVDRGEFVTADTVIYCDNVGRAVDPQICCEEVPFADKIIAATGLANVRPSRMLYIARTDTKARPMRNEQALIERLAVLGFEIFVGSRHSVAEQIRAFREAKLIVAPHGAGLTNIMYSHPGTILLELQQSGYVNAGLMRLAQLGNIRYHSEVFFPAISESFSESWVVDVDRVIEVISKIAGSLG